MEVRFVQRGTEIDDKLRSYMAGKISKMDKFFHKILNGILSGICRPTKSNTLLRMLL